MSATNNREAKFWNRETSKRQAFSTQAPIVKPAKLISLSDPNDPANDPVHELNVQGVELLQIGSSIQDFDIEYLQQQDVNCIFVSHPNARETLASLLQEFSTIEWVHTRSAGIDFCTSNTLTNFSGIVTNAKGQFSSTLAEYSMLACAYFAKDLPRLLQSKRHKNWDKYSVLELRGSTIGIVGYGDIGRACARLARAYGMRIVAHRRRRTTDDDPLIVDQVYYGRDGLNQLFAESDYILCALPLTAETQNMIGTSQFQSAKENAVFINVGRGPIVDEQALIQALQDGTLKGAALDVFCQEPLPTDSPLWTLDNVLLSPHNMDKTATFMHESSEFFVQEQLPRFVRGEELLNRVDPAAGY